ncbi:MAG: type 4a pilus biogenesis protein PilO [Proteobacteria bacterium]|nr:type 4a pilus biogenesis protein PilO [Pseudomonadota bacterium]
MANMKNIDIAAQFRGLNGRNPGLWPIVPRLVCALLMAVFVVALGWYFYWSDQMDTLAQGAQQEETLRKEYQDKLQQAINLDALRQQKKQAEEYVATLEKQLPSKAEMDALLSDINQAGLGRGLQFELFKPGSQVVKDYYAEQPINIKVNGSYHDIGAFAGDIASLPRIVTLNNLNLVVGQGGALSLDAVAKTFRYLDRDEVDAQRKAAAKDKKGAKK